MYHDVMNQKPSMGAYGLPSKFPSAKSQFNHEIQLLFKYENLLLCVCVRMKYFPGPEQSFIYLFI